MGKSINYASRSAEDKYFARLERGPELPGCMATGCLEDANLEMSLDDILLCSLHWTKVSRLPFIKEQRERLTARERARGDNIKTHDAAQEATETGAMQSVVYYICFAQHIKIGTTTNLEHRMSEMHVHPGSLLAAEPGNRLVERQRHIIFRDERYQRTELFEPSERLLEHIAHVRSLFGDPKNFMRNQSPLAGDLIP